MDDPQQEPESDQLPEQTAPEKPPLRERVREVNRFTRSYGDLK